jgi:outer membrane protein TolC
MGIRPDLELAELSVRAGKTEVSLAKATRWDDFGIGLFVEGERFRDEPEGIEPEALVGVRFNLPLPLWQNGSGKVAEKQAAQERKNRQLEALRLSVKNEALTAHQVMNANYRAAALLRDKILPSARQIAADTEAAHGRAEVDAQSVFRARERLVGIELSAVEARKKFFQSYSEWLGALGEPAKKP